MDVSFCGNHLPKLITMSTGEVNTTYKRKGRLLPKWLEKKTEVDNCLVYIFGDISQNIEHPRHSLSAVFSSPSDVLGISQVGDILPSVQPLFFMRVLKGFKLN